MFPTLITGIVGIMSWGLTIILAVLLLTSSARSVLFIVLHLAGGAWQCLVQVNHSANFRMPSAARFARKLATRVVSEAVNPAAESVLDSLHQESMLRASFSFFSLYLKQLPHPGRRRTLR